MNDDDRNFRCCLLSILIPATVALIAYLIMKYGTIF